VLTLRLSYLRLPNFRLPNFKGDLFATAVSFGAQAAIRLGASLILTRILRPEAYGIIAIVTSIGYVVALLGDIAVTVSLVRHEHGETTNYLNTAWTLRLGRGLLNTVLMFFAAPLIANLYHTAELVMPLRAYSLWFLIAPLESMSFPLAIRRRNSRIIVYSELVATAIATIFSLAYCYYARTYWGMIYGILLNRLLVTVMSYAFYRDVRPRLMIDRGAARELLRLTRYAVPSSLVTIGMNQFDKAIFLRLFDLPLLGVFGLASSIAAPVDSLINKVSQLVLYPRCAHDFRTAPDRFAVRYYTRNTSLYMSILALPAAIGGAAPLLVHLLYDPRYAQAGTILEAFMVRSSLLSLAGAAECMLIAAGELQAQLHGNIVRAVSVVAGTLAGYYLAGFMGFVYGAVLSVLPQLLYYLWLQRRKGYLMVGYEAYKLLFMVATFALAYLVSHLLLRLFPIRLRI
jgi:lipopolysaccharide exporter